MNTDTSAATPARNANSNSTSTRDAGQPAFLSDYSTEQEAKAEIRKVLVVISPDLVTPAAPEKSPLLDRAIALAKATGCELELFHVVHDNSLTPARYIDPSDYAQERKKRLNHEATLMAELVLRLNLEDVNVTHDTRWDAPRTEAILRKINASQPDIVMKQSREYSYLMGLMSNTDWDLIRQSPAHLWFVNDESDDRIDHIVTAVGASEDAENAIAPADYDVFRLANKVADAYDAKNTPVHAYQLPVGLSHYAAYAPALGTSAMPQSDATSDLNEQRRATARAHGREIEAFAQYFAIDTERVQVQEGHPADVLTTTAESLSAGLIVMAARNLTRWQRFFQSVNAERVLAGASCDVLFVKDPQKASVPNADARSLTGRPAYDLEQAITDPSVTFGSPQALVDAIQISVPMRQRILQLWEQDVRAQMVEEDEGGPVRPTKSALLEEIRSARLSLRTDRGQDADQSQQLTG